MRRNDKFRVEQQDADKGPTCACGHSCLSDESNRVMSCATRVRPGGAGG